MARMVRAPSSILILVLIAGCATGAPPPPDPEAGFQPLFNGRDLSGWVYGTRAGKPTRSGAGYQLADGVVFCTEQDGGDFFTAAEYGDFVLRFDVRLAANGNNGVGIRAPLEGDAAYLGLELQVLDNAGSQYRSLRPEQYHGSIYDVVAARRGHLRSAGEWNSQEITARGSRITVVLNGQVILDADLDEVKDPAVLAKHPGLRSRRGHIGFLGHGSRVEYRNLRLKPL
jgi:hypothetical protein